MARFIDNLSAARRDISSSSDIDPLDGLRTSSAPIHFLENFPTDFLLLQTTAPTPCQLDFNDAKAKSKFCCHFKVNEAERAALNPLRAEVAAPTSGWPLCQCGSVDLSKIRPTTAGPGLIILPAGSARLGEARLDYALAALVPLLAEPLPALAPL